MQMYMLSGIYSHKMIDILFWKLFIKCKVVNVFRINFIYLHTCIPSTSRITGLYIVLCGMYILASFIFIHKDFGYNDLSVKTSL